MAIRAFELSIPGQNTSRVYGAIVDTETELVVGGLLFPTYDAADAFVTWSARVYGRVNSSTPRDVLASLKEKFDQPSKCNCSQSGADIKPNHKDGEHEGGLRMFFVTAPGSTTDLTQVVPLCDDCAARIEYMEDLGYTIEEVAVV